MKRSEMVKVIEKAMRCWNGAYFDDSLESHILECIEEAGMLPPNVLDKPTSEKLTKFQEKIFREDFAEIHCHVWEPEDES